MKSVPKSAESVFTDSERLSLWTFLGRSRCTIAARTSRSYDSQQSTGLVYIFIEPRLPCEEESLLGLLSSFSGNRLDESTSFVLADQAR